MSNPNDFDMNRIDSIIAESGIGREILPGEVREIIELAVSEGIFSDRVVVEIPEPGTRIRLGLRLTDTATLFSEDLSQIHYLDPHSDTKREAVIHVLNQALEVLVEVHDELRLGRQADWKQIPVLGKG